MQDMIVVCVWVFPTFRGPVTQQTHPCYTGNFRLLHTCDEVITDSVACSEPSCSAAVVSVVLSVDIPGGGAGPAASSLRTLDTAQ